MPDADDLARRAELIARRVAERRYAAWHLRANREAYVGAAMTAAAVEAVASVLAEVIPPIVDQAVEEANRQLKPMVVADALRQVVDDLGIADEERVTFGRIRQALELRADELERGGEQ